MSPAPGSRVEVCARLMSADYPVPYLAAITWSPGAPVNTAMVESLMETGPNPGDTEIYLQCANRMMALIRGGGNNHSRINCRPIENVEKFSISASDKFTVQVPDRSRCQCAPVM